MRIAVWHNLPSGGGKRALHGHVKGLVERGHAITVFCPPSADTTYLPLRDLAHEEVIPLGKSQAPSWAPLVRFAQGDAEAFSRVTAMKVHAAAFADRVNTGEFDVVFVNSCWWFFTPFVGRHLKRPAAVYLAEPNRRLYEATPELPWLAEAEAGGPWWHPSNIRRWMGSAVRSHPARMLAREELANVRAFDRVLVNSLYSREVVLRTFGIEARVCYLGIDTEKFACSSAPREPFVLSVGFFNPHKNPLFIIRAVAASRHRPRLMWIANGVDERCLGEAKRLAGELGVALHVDRGVTDARLVDLYHRASIFLFAPRLEPFGLAPLEAMSCGTPVVAVAEAGVRETVVDGETGEMVQPEPEQMAAAIDRLLDEPAAARDMGLRGAVHVRQHWTLEAATGRLERQLDALVRQGRSARNGGHRVD